MRVRIFTVWHQRVFPELLADVPEEDRDAVVLYGVNENIAKDPVDVPMRVIYEYKLLHYEPVWQAQGYCQTSCMIHALLNGFYNDVDYIGFAQYDMKWSAKTVRHIKDTVSANQDKQYIFHELTLPVAQALGYSRGWDHVLEHYNSYFGTKWTFPQILARADLPKLPVVHTFVIPTVMFIKMMEWIYAYLRLVQRTVYPSNISQAEFAERIHGLFLVLECLANRDVVMTPFQIEHKWPYYHDQVPFEGYKCLAAQTL
jgi:hypothetical protein